jgi:hypothetical protein
MYRIIRNLVSAPVDSHGDGLDVVCADHLGTLERMPFFADPTFPISASARDWLCDFPLPWQVLDCCAPAGVKCQFRIVDARGVVVAVGIPSVEHGQAVIDAWVLYLWGNS